VVTRPFEDTAFECTAFGDPTATPAGIAFSFDPYQVGPYAEGAPTVFLPRAELGGCVKSLPAYP
jgi:hypothetical protein